MDVADQNGPPLGDRRFIRGAMWFSVAVWSFNLGVLVGRHVG